MSCKTVRACGTVAKYVKDKCRCEPCRDAYAEYRRNKKKRAEVVEAAKPPVFEIRADPAMLESYWDDLFEQFEQENRERFFKLSDAYKTEFPERFGDD
jgi:hypothetical protein